MSFLSVIDRLNRWLEEKRAHLVAKQRARSIDRIAVNDPEKLKALIDEGWARLNEYQIAQLHRSTGAALTTWATMEERLIIVASLLLKSQPRKVGLVFYSIINFQVWIAVITELFGMEPDFASFQKRWNRTYERLRAEKDNRDRLAHNAAVSEDPSSDPLRQTVKKASRFDTRAKSRSFVPMDTELVIQFGERVAAISDDLLKLVDDMTDHLESKAPNASQDISSAPNPDQAG